MNNKILTLDYLKHFVKKSVLKKILLIYYSHQTFSIFFYLNISSIPTYLMLMDLTL